MSLLWDEVKQKAGTTEYVPRLFWFFTTENQLQNFQHDILNLEGVEKPALRLPADVEYDYLPIKPKAKEVSPFEMMQKK